MSAETSPPIGLDIDYAKSVDSVCKIIEGVLGLCTFICAVVWGSSYGGGWVQFVGIFAFIVVLILYMMHLFRIIYKIPAGIPMPFVELIICGVFVLFYFIAGVVAAVKAQYLQAIAAACVFSFMSMVAFAVDTFLKFQEWRQGVGMIQTSSSQTTTTTTTVAQEQY